MKKDKETLKRDRQIVLMHSLQQSISKVSLCAEVPLAAKLKDMAIKMSHNAEELHIKNFVDLASMDQCKAIMAILEESCETHSDKLIAAMAPAFLPEVKKANEMMASLTSSNEAIIKALIAAFNFEYHTGTQMTFKPFENAVKDRMQFLHGMAAGMAAAADMKD